MDCVSLLPSIMSLMDQFARKRMIKLLQPNSRLRRKEQKNNYAALKSDLFYSFTVEVQYIVTI
jgi:hypothetical protein